MIDIHTHILPEIDDGLGTWSEFIEVTNLAKAGGIEKIVATPHIIDGRLNSKQITKILKESQAKVSTEICFGAELSLLWAIDKSSDILREYTLNQNGCMLLIELSYIGQVMGLRDFFWRLRGEGFTPIIAHIERYPYLELENYHELRISGVFFQVNIGSFLGHHGTAVKNKALLLLNNNLISLLATDLHRREDYFDFANTVRKLEKMMSTKQLELFFKHNPSRVLRGVEPE